MHRFLNLANYSIITVMIVAALISVYGMLSPLNYNYTVFYGRIFFHLAIILYYLLHSQKTSWIYLCIIIIFCIGDCCFSIDGTSTYGFIAACISRGLLFFSLLKGFHYKRNTTNKVILSLSVAIVLLMIYLLFKNTLRFYAIIGAGVFSFGILIVSFLNFLETPKKGHIQMLTAIALWILFDITFAIQDIALPYKLDRPLVMIIYNISYYCICVSMLKKAQNNILSF